MKTSLWDVLSIFLVLGVVLLMLAFGSIFSNPTSPFNPFPPSTPIAQVFIPSSTPAAAALPATWTATPAPVEVQSTPTLRASSTPVATRTPFVLPSPTKIPALVIPTNTRIPLEGRCKVVSQNPSDGTRLKFGSEFRASWTLENNSDATWDSGSSDVRFKEGKAMQTGPAVIDLPLSVAPGSTTLITITMRVPEVVGYQIAYWTISSGDKALCTFYIEIFAEK